MSLTFDNDWINVKRTLLTVYNVHRSGQQWMPWVSVVASKIGA